MLRNELWKLRGPAKPTMENEDFSKIQKMCKKFFPNDLGDYFFFRIKQSLQSPQREGAPLVSPSFSVLADDPATLLSSTAAAANSPSPSPTRYMKKITSICTGDGTFASSEIPNSTCKSDSENDSDKENVPGEINHRSKRKASQISISYKEPSLHAKLRQGDPNTFGIPAPESILKKKRSHEQKENK